MKKLIPFALIFFILIGCQTYRYTIQTEPDDAKIYVDGKYLGQGIVTVDAGVRSILRGHGYPKKMKIIIKHDEFEMLVSDIKTKVDIMWAIPMSLVYLGIGSYNTIMWLTEPTYPDYWGYIGIAYIATSPLSFLNTQKFEDYYFLPLKAKE